MYELIVKILERTGDAAGILQHIVNVCRKQFPPGHVKVGINHALQALEVMLSEGWVRGAVDPARPRLQVTIPEEGHDFHPTETRCPVSPDAAATVRGGVPTP